jgi:hypothetical protein
MVRAPEITLAHHLYKLTHCKEKTEEWTYHWVEPEQPLSKLSWLRTGLKDSLYELHTTLKSLLSLQVREEISMILAESCL